MPPGNGQGKPPDWIPPGLRPEDEGIPFDDLHGDWYWDLDDGLAGNGTAFSDKASGGFYELVWIKPTTSRLISPQLSPIVTVKPISNDGTLMTVEIESATDASFTTGVTTTTLTSRPSGVDVSTVLGPFTDKTTVYLRSRAGGSGNWSAWMGTIQMSLNAAAASAAHIENMNVGVTLPVVQNAAHIECLNVGVNLPLVKHAVHIDCIGDVNTATPTPQIWGIFPTAGREGDGFTIYGHGFGATAATYNGTAIMEMAPDVVLSVSAWVQVAAGAHAYDALRYLDVSTSPPTITMEYQRIDVTVPNGAIPPGYPVRVDTDGA